MGSGFLHICSRRLLALALGALLAGGVVVGCGDDDGSGDDLGSGVVAKVGDEEISEEDLEREVDALARAQSPLGGKEPAAAARRQLRDQALTTLLTREAIEREAADRGIEVSDVEIQQRWKAASSDQFKTKKALRRFLGGQSQQDVLDQLRLQTLSERINQQVAEKAGGGKEGAKAVDRFQQEFRQRWTEQTTCADGYAAAGCADETARK